MVDAQGRPSASRSTTSDSAFGRSVVAETAEASHGSFGSRLSTVRRAAGLSQTDLAGDDLSASYISLLEAGKRHPSGEVAALLARRLGCSVSELVDGQKSERERRLELELAYSQLALTHGEAGSARERLEAFLSEESLDLRSRDEALLLLASAHEKLADATATLDILLPLFERSRRRESHLPVSSVGVVLCGCYLDSGDYHRAVTVGEQAFAAAVDQGLTGTDDYFRLAATLMSAHHEVGDVLHAASWAKSLIVEVEAQGTSAGQAAIYWNAAVIAETLGRTDEALHLSQRALTRMAEQGSSRDLARLRIAAAQLLLAVHPPRADEAWHTLEVAYEQLADLGSKVDRGQWSMVAAMTRLHLGSVAEARRLAAEAVAVLQGADHLDAAEAQITLGDTLEAQRDPAAVQHYESARDWLAAGPRSRSSARLWRDLGDRFLQAGEHESAAIAFRSALDGQGVRDRSAGTRAAIERARAAGATARALSPQATP